MIKTLLFEIALFGYFFMYSAQCVLWPSRRQIDWGKGEDLLDVLRESAYASTGPTHRHQRFEAVVVSKDENGVTVDYGGKFHARVRMSPR